MRQLRINNSFTNRDIASLDKYLHDISKLPMVSVEEETSLAIKIKGGDGHALGKIHFRQSSIRKLKHIRPGKNIVSFLN